MTNIIMSIENFLTAVENSIKKSKKIWIQDGGIIYIDNTLYSPDKIIFLHGKLFDYKPYFEDIQGNIYTCDTTVYDAGIDIENSNINVYLNTNRQQFHKFISWNFTTEIRYLKSLCFLIHKNNVILRATKKDCICKLLNLRPLNSISFSLKYLNYKIIPIQKDELCSSGAATEEVHNLISWCDNTKKYANKRDKIMSRFLQSERCNPENQDLRINNFYVDMHYLFKEVMCNYNLILQPEEKIKFSSALVTEFTGLYFLEMLDFTDLGGKND